MKIYIDESGNTGCVLNSKGKINFEQQPLFAIGAVIVKDEKEEAELINKYEDFKRKFGFEEEIKGSDLLTRENNKALEWFVNKILDDKHFQVTLYSKKYYLSTLLIRAMIGNEFADKEPVAYHALASALSLQKDDFFYKYCEFIEKPTAESLEKYLEFICKYKYEKSDGIEFMIIDMAKAMLEKGKLEVWLEDFMTFGWYENSSITNLINLNALAEYIFMYKLQNQSTNGEMKIIHDNIDEFEKTFVGELGAYNIDIEFGDSKKEILLQMADNIASIFCHCMKRMTKHFERKAEWKEESRWDMELTSRIIRRIGIDNIKFTIPIHDWAAAVCVEQMFAPEYPKAYRKNIYFNPMYLKAQEKIIESIMFYSKYAEKIEETLEK